MTFQFFKDKIYSYIYKKNHFATCQFGKIGVLANFITQKLKSKHLALLVFSSQRFIWGNERKYFPHIPGLEYIWVEIQCSVHFGPLYNWGHGNLMHQFLKSLYPLNSRRKRFVIQFRRRKYILLEKYIKPLLSTF